MIEATLQSVTGTKFVRIASCGYVVESQLKTLKPQELHKVDCCGDVREKWFQRLDMDGVEILADVITGRVYRADTGMGSSVHMRIIK